MYFYSWFRLFIPSPFHYFRFMVFRSAKINLFVLLPLFFFFSFRSISFFIYCLLYSLILSRFAVLFLFCVLFSVEKLWFGKLHARTLHTATYYGIKSRKWCVLILAAHSWFAFLSRFIDGCCGYVIVVQCTYIANRFPQYLCVYVFFVCACERDLPII